MALLRFTLAPSSAATPYSVTTASLTAVTLTPPAAAPDASPSGTTISGATALSQASLAAPSAHVTTHAFMQADSDSDSISEFIPTPAVTSCGAAEGAGSKDGTSHPPPPASPTHSPGAHLSLPSPASPSSHSFLHRASLLRIPDLSRLTALAAVKSGPDADDGFVWRKYGQKLIRACARPRLYFRCGQPGCPARKTEDRAADGKVLGRTYLASPDGSSGLVVGKAEHKRKGSSSCGGASGGEEGGFHAWARCKYDASTSVKQHRTTSGPTSPSQRTPTNSSSSAGVPSGVSSGAAPGSPSGVRMVCAQQVVEEPRVVVRVRGDADMVDDGYHWRKYGHKLVGGNTFPRSYYRCTSGDCRVRKQVERSKQDPSTVVTTYEGRHNHSAPGPILCLPQSL
ncbi:unnamed protein product [Closterium sp. Yama58-4]|nr:unnamed protein product [Closterium sp. Yama58-4]